MLFLGLGTGMGSAIVTRGRVQGLELAHLPYRKNRTYEDYLGLRGLKRMGREKWSRHVVHVMALLREALQADSATLGGGNARKARGLPRGIQIADNSDAIAGGLRLWEDVEGRNSRSPGSLDRDRIRGGGARGRENTALTARARVAQS